MFIHPPHLPHLPPMEHRCKNLRDVQGYCCSFPKPNSANFSIWALSVFVLSLGHTDPGFDPDIICETDVESLTNLHMGFVSLAGLLKQTEIDRERGSMLVYFAEKFFLFGSLWLEFLKAEKMMQMGSSC